MSFLSDVPLFAGLGPELLEKLESRFVTKRYRRNTVIIQEGDASNAVFVVVSGRLKVFVSDEQGREVVVNELGPGACFGELAMLTHEPRSASVMTLGDSELRSINEKTFYELLQGEPSLAMYLVEHLAHKVVSLTRDVSDLALLDVYGRVRNVLIKLAEPGEDGLPQIARITQQDIASRVGASREMVSRIFKDLKKGAYIRIEGKRITLLQDLPEHW